MHQASLILAVRPVVRADHWAALKGLTMRLRALVDAAHDADQGNERARHPKRVEDALRSLEADISQHADRLTEDLLRARLPKKPQTPALVGDIPDLIGLA